MPYLALKDEMTSAKMLWGLLSSLGEERSEEVALAVALAAERGAAFTVVAESSIWRSLRESCSDKVHSAAVVELNKACSRKPMQYQAAAGQCNTQRHNTGAAETILASKSSITEANRATAKRR